MAEQEKKAWSKIFLSALFILVVILLLIIYWFIPFNATEYKIKSGHFNFTLNNFDETEMQFYQNMRYPDSKISYRIYDCPLKKKNDMEEAFIILSNKTLLEFYSVETNEEIFVTCDDKNRIEEGLFIAGEGGPTNITPAGDFNVIAHGTILLIKESKCERPNIALHELLHTLGFEHSQNPSNIMYPISGCAQTIGDDIIELINELYSIPNYPDLAFENISAVMNGRYLNANISIRNNGLEKSEETKIKIYADEKFAKEIVSSPLEIGHGSIILLKNILINKISFNELIFYIDYNFNELKKENNKVVLEIIK
jgi:hypothetical protein